MFEDRKNAKYPVIYKALHSVNTKIAVHIPYREGTRKELKALLNGGHVDFCTTTKKWEMASKHIEVVTAYLVEKFGSCELQIMTSNVELCTTQCQTAKVRPINECECVCGGHNHGDGWPEGWKLAARSGELLVKGTRKIEIFTIHKGSEGALLREKPKKVEAPIRLPHQKSYKYMAADSYYQHMMDVVAAESARADELMQKPVGYITEDGIEVVVVKHLFTKEMVKTLNYPDDHDYVVYQATLAGDYSD